MSSDRHGGPPVAGGGAGRPGTARPAHAGRAGTAGGTGTIPGPPVVLPAGTIALRPRPPAAPAPARSPGAEAAAPAPEMPAIDLSSVRREAFDRGREVERQAAAAVLRGAAAALQQAVTASAAARRKEEEDVAEFGVGLGLVVAEELVGAAVRRDAHDVHGQVRRILSEVLADAGETELLLEAHPDDLHLLPADIGSAGEGVRLVLAPDPRAPRGSFRVRGGGIEFRSSVAERLEVVRTRLRELIGHHAGPAQS